LDFLGERKAHTDDIAFHEKAGLGQRFLYFVDKVFLRRVATVAILPSALSVSDVRSVQVGRSRFSRCCHLLVDLPFHRKRGKLGQAFDAVTGTRRCG
jgi:hypothetical protein